MFDAFDILARCYTMATICMFCYIL